MQLLSCATVYKHFDEFGGKQTDIVVTQGEPDSHWWAYTMYKGAHRITEHEMLSQDGEAFVWRVSTTYLSEEEQDALDMYGSED